MSGVKKNPNYMTPRGLKALQDEAQNLIKVERPEVVKTVAWAASNGDRSENADHIYGKRRLRQIDSRLKYLTEKIETAHIVDPEKHQGDKVVFGATVTIEEEDGEQKTFQIVGEDEINTEGGRISWKSPMAKALLGKQVGDEVLVRKPKGDTWVEIVQLDFISSQ